MIRRFWGREILDSRGRPTLSVGCELADGTRGVASVPSGMSKGAKEAVELRDGDERRYAGWGCLSAVKSVEEISRSFGGTDVADQSDLDRRLNEIDGTPNKSRLGSNAVLGVSLAFARASAHHASIPLYRYFAELAGIAPHIPELQINLFSGGAHAGGRIAIQDVMVVPHLPSVDEALVAMSAVYSAAAKLVESRYGGWRLTADEGGLAPASTSVTQFLQDAADSVSDAGFEVGAEASLCVDVAASQFFCDERYRIDGQELDDKEMVENISNWVRQFSLASVEDGLADSRMSEWPLLARAIEDRALIIGDDLLCTNPALIEAASQMRACNGLLLKLNQIGSVTEGLAALQKARDAGWKVIVSARSGDTEDNWLSDLAVGWAGDFIKVGSITQSERLAKYNRLLEIEQLLEL